MNEGRSCIDDVHRFGRNKEGDASTLPRSLRPPQLSLATLTATLEMSAASATLAQQRVALAASGASAARDASRGRVVTRLSGVPPARARARPLCAPSRAPSSLAAYADDRRVLGDVSAGEETRAADVPGAGAADVPGADAFAAHLASLTDPGELDKLTALLPPRLRDALRDPPPQRALHAQRRRMGGVPAEGLGSSRRAKAVVTSPGARTLPLCPMLRPQPLVLPCASSSD